jgi:hypothetical protein
MLWHFWHPVNSCFFIFHFRCYHPTISFNRFSVSCSMANRSAAMSALLRGRGVLVKIFVEVYFITNFGFVFVPPGIIGKGYYFPFKKGLYIFFQRYVFVIFQSRVAYIFNAAVFVFLLYHGCCFRVCPAYGTQ